MQQDAHLASDEESARNAKIPDLLHKLFSNPANVVEHDIRHAVARPVVTRFHQQPGGGRSITGLRVEFEISFHGLGKCGPAGQPLYELAELCGMELDDGSDDE